ncbi:inactive tyrosine-protein kinase 7 isoform X2 [Microcaecilia unicolor]|uniref:Inactive tyrosine-protein kinase 7 n=1 Tax=Microcaecilia unicolor TaxID=1415580 RepID=A0A6P7XMF7_9AMPH|nr:inactive tyrosine-protein kinase 7 isoform X2 [Microcaecilia unicolor]
MERGRCGGRWSLLLLLLQAACMQCTILFTKEPSSQDALNGRAAILRCEVEDPTHVQFEWLQNGISISDSERRFKEGSNLQFTAVDWKQDAGNFQCVARNSMTGEEARTVNASFNIKWIESGSVVLKNPATITEIQSGAAVTLRCHIDGHPRPTCQWFRDGSQVTGDGINYSINNKARTLTLKSVSPEDNGLYYCCARNAMGSVCSNDNFTLNIIDESFPRPLNIPQSQIVNKNEEAIFHCQFTAMPPPLQVWYFEEENSPISNETQFTVFPNGSLLVKTPRTGTYRCEGRGQRGKPIVLEATLQLAEIEDMNPFSGKEFTANTVQRIACSPPRGLPEPTVWWERKGVKIPQRNRVYQDGNDLVFSLIAEKDAGIYTCHAANKAGERKQDLNITVATIPKWLEMPADSFLEESKPGYLHCLTKASLKPTVEWYRNGNRISDDSRFLIFENGTLRISSVDVYDGTVYKCVSSTRAGSIDAQARVTVLEKLKFTPPPQPQQCLEFERPATLLCSATGQEKPSIYWTKLDGSSMPTHVQPNSGILYFRNVTRSDASNYTCIASNSQQGEIRAVVQLIVAVFISFKLEPENTTVYQGHTAVLHCQAMGDPLPQIQWKGKDGILDSSKYAPRIQLMSNGSLVIYDVTNEDSGKYTCIAGNICNIKHKDAFLYVVDKPIADSVEPGSHTPYKMIQTIGLSVGAAVAYIIIVLGLMFYCKKRRKARRLQKHPDGEEPEMECLNGGGLLQNGQTTSEIQEEVALTNLGNSSSANKQHSVTDKMHLPRANLQKITMLGKSDFGDVFLAKAKGIQDGETETVVLVKSLQTKDEQLQLNFRREFEMFAKLNHINVVRLLGLCREVEPHYMILEYVDLGDLKQYLRISKSKDEKVKLQPISTKQKVSICTQVALGMEHLSNSRFVHKDLAARNCLVSAQRQVKVSALGLSKDVYNSEYYHFHQAWIPLRWMPPEAVLEDEFSTKSDVWSFGVFMWEVFTLGELPYSKLEDDEVLAGLQNGKMKLPSPEDCPSKLYKLMQRCWASSPKDRPSFSEIANTLGDTPSDSKI